MKAKITLKPKIQTWNRVDKISYCYDIIAYGECPYCKKTIIASEKNSRLSEELKRYRNYVRANLRKELKKKKK